jgi:hypothetical protein
MKIMKRSTMIHTNNKLLGTAALVAMCGLAGAAPADIIQAQFNSVSPSKTVAFSLNSGDSYSNTSAGSFNWTRIGGDYAGAGATDTFVTYCIELLQHISYNQTYNYEVASLAASPQPGAGMGSVRANQLRELWGRYHNDGFANNNDAAAFQVAVWEITHDDGLSLSAGQLQFQNNGQWWDTAQNWLTSLDGTGPMANLSVMSSATRQDQVFEVPNPASAAMLTMAGICGATTRRRRNRIVQ